MKIAIDDIKASPTELSYSEDVAELNTRLGRGGMQDWRLSAGLNVDVTHSRAGLELFFHGTLHGRVVGSCARCLEEYIFGLDHPFAFVLMPKAAAGTHAAALSAEDMALSYYEGDEVHLTPLVHEQAILALPTRPLCDEACRGLCSRCGANLNAGPCNCPAEPADGRLAVLHALTRAK